MINRSIDMIFEPSGQPIPSKEEVQFEAREIVQRSGWGMPLIEALRRLRDPYWREAIARYLMEKWRDLVRDKDEQTYYFDMDGDRRLCWSDAEYDFSRIIRNSTNEQVELEQAMPKAPAQVVPVYCMEKPAPNVTNVTNYNNFHIDQNTGSIITDSNVTIHKH